VRPDPETSAEESLRVRARGITRRFGQVAALDGADLDVRAGEVHALLGENGAGKSTLLGILAGTLRPDGGVLELKGAPVALRSPREAWSHGIGLVHQHFALVPSLTVLENLALGLRDGGGWALPEDRVRADAMELARRTGLVVPLDALVSALGVGERQRVEIVKALLRDPLLLALDEPTSVLSPKEVDSLFELLRSLADSGRSVLLVAHKIDEVLRVADRVTVLRRGRTTLATSRAEVDAPALIRAMVGRDVRDGAAVGWGGPGGGESAGAGEPIASLERVWLLDHGGRASVEDVSLQVHRGEVLGIAGVEGNGQREVALLLAGRVSPTRGTVQIPDRVGFIPEDRTTEGIIADFDIAENVALALHDDPSFATGPFLRWNAIRSHAAEVRTRFGVQAPDIATRAFALSGGNQQRLIVGRELSRDPDLVIAENPTRGLDVAATSFVHEELVRMARTGRRTGVVIVSSDLDEVLALSDRVVVMTRGRAISIGDAQRTRGDVGSVMLGGRGAVE
jgi:ABC-type uncharacterized transport system ATPase subunit